jgi:Ulp1 family protease
LFYLVDELKSKKKKITEPILHSTVINNNTTTEASSSSNNHPIEILDEADEIVPDIDNQIKTISDSLVNPKNRSHTPAIIMFDSLRAGSKTRVAATLREFLQLEYDHKKTLPTGSLARKLFNLDTIPTIEAAVPQQPNYFDCGLYVLQYIESFFAHRSPTINFQSTATFENWCENNCMGSSKRKQIFHIISQHAITKGE